MRDSTGRLVISWTTDEITRAITLWAAGKSAAQIAKELGRGRTRSAVIGRLHRLRLKVQKGRRIAPAVLVEGVPQHDNPIAALEPPSPPAPRVKPPKAKPVEIEPLAPIAADPTPIRLTGFVTFRDLRECHCRYVVGAVDGLDTRYCGATRQHPSPYCVEHRAIVRGTGTPSERRALSDFTAKSVRTGAYR